MNEEEPSLDMRSGALVIALNHLRKGLSTVLGVVHAGQLWCRATRQTEINVGAKTETQRQRRKTVGRFWYEVVAGLYCNPAGE